VSGPGIAAELPSADFLDIESLLSDPERERLAEVRRFLAREVVPAAAQWWNRAEFPDQLLPGLAGLGVSTPVQQGFSHLFGGLVIAEMTRADTSVATFFMVHHDLFVQALHRFGSPEQRGRLLEDAMNLRITGAFALTEPDHGSDVSGGMETTAAYREGAWILNGAKRWIGNGTFCDYMLLWARDADSGEIRGFILDATLPGVSRSRIENKTALRTVQNADIVLKDVRVAEADRLAAVSSFDDTRDLLQGSRIMVGWQAVGQQLAAFDAARAYAVQRHQFGRPLAAFQLVQEQLVRMLGNATASMAMMARLAQMQDAAQMQDTAQPVPAVEVGAGAGMAQAALAKAFTTARMRETVALGRSIFGGNGIVTDYPMAKIFADAEAIYTYEGSYEINSLIVGRAVTGISAIA
jgi:glutaryl-CoA dehydrogenase